MERLPRRKANHSACRGFRNAGLVPFTAASRFPSRAAEPPLDSSPPRTSSLALTYAELQLEGHLTCATLEHKLRQLSLRVAVPKAMLIDASRMTDYDMDSRTYFVSWMRERYKDIQGVAIVTDNTIWHMVIRAMSLASSVRMQAFRDRKQALLWLSDLNR